MDNDLLFQLIIHQMNHVSDMPNKDNVIEVYDRIRDVYNTHNTCNVDGVNMTIFELNIRWISIVRELNNNEQKALVYLKGAEDLIEIYRIDEPGFVPYAEDHFQCMRDVFAETMIHRGLIREVIPKIGAYLMNDITKIKSYILNLLDALVRTSYEHEYTDIQQIESELVRVEVLVSKVNVLISETQKDRQYRSYEFVKDFIESIKSYYNKISNKVSI